MHLRALRPASRLVLGISVLLLAWGIVALIVNPDFSSGDDSSLDRLLGFDVNGWHAMLLILLAAPGIVAGLLEPEVAGPYAGAVAAGLIVLGIALLADTSTVALAILPSEDANGVLFLVLGVLYGLAALLYVRDRARA